MIKRPYKADIYSAGIILFNFLMGHMPFYEDKKLMGQDMYTVLTQKPEKFWILHQQKAPGKIVPEEFKVLFQAMVHPNPKERPSIAEIRTSSWFNRETYTAKELKEVIKGALSQKR
mmetsp:Transcript_84/g.84  ORF Transcript_84/g.84 Transcript_84/m.84 type:complete len:116 (-) Transcript_84:604-951(-)